MNESIINKMSVEWIILVASLIIVWLVIKAMLKLVVIGFNTAFQVFIILIVLRIAFTIMPEEVWQQIRQFPELIPRFF